MQFNVQVEGKDFLTIKATNTKEEFHIIYHVPIIEWNNYLRGSISIEDIDITDEAKRFLKNGTNKNR